MCDQIKPLHYSETDKHRKLQIGTYFGPMTLSIRDIIMVTKAKARSRDEIAQKYRTICSKRDPTVQEIDVPWSECCGKIFLPEASI